jgi:hypothetical protein
LLELILILLDYHKLTYPSFKPEFILSDINNDGKNELIVISTSGSGTGVHIEDIHVFGFNTDSSLYDIYVMDPLGRIYQNVKPEMTKKNGNVTIKINVQGREFIMTAKESSLGMWGDDVGFGSAMYYAVVDNKLTVKVTAAVGNGVPLRKIKEYFLVE